MSPKSKIEITSASDFRDKVGLTEPVTLEWEEGKVVEATQTALDSLRASMEGKAATKKREMAETFIRENEKKDAIAKLTDKLGDNFLKNPAVLAAAGTLAAGTAAVVSQLDHKAKEVTGEDVGFMDSFRDWFKDAANKSDGVMKKIWMFFYTLMGGKKEKEEEQSTEKPASEKYTPRAEKGASKIFDKLLRGDNPPDATIRTVFITPQFLRSTPEELRELRNTYAKDTKGLAKKMGFPEAEGEKVLKAIDFYFSKNNQDLLQSARASNENIEKVTLAVSYAKTLKYEQLLEKIKEKRLDQLDSRDISFADSIPTGDDVKEFIGEKKEILDALREKYAGFSPKILRMMHTTYASEPITNLDFRNRESELKKGANGEQGEWEFVTQKLPEYAKTLPSLVRSCAFGNPDAQKVIENHLKNPGLKQPDLIDFFVLSGGNPDFQGMNGYEKAQVVLRVMIMLRSSGTPEAKEAGYTYFFSMVGSILDKEKSMDIPPEVKNILRDTVGLFYKGIGMVIDEAKAFTLSLVKKNPGYSALGAGGIITIVYLATQAVPVLRVASAIAILLKLGIITAAMFVGYKWIESDGVFQNEKTGEKHDPEKIAKDILKK